MVLSHRHRFIFVKTAKTAGTSIEVFLSPLCGPEDVLTPFAFAEPGHRPRNTRGVFNPIPELSTVLRSRGPRGGAFDLALVAREFLLGRKLHHMHLAAWQIRSRAGKSLWDEYFTFCVERNPWDKVVSSWHYLNAFYDAGITFDEYLAFCERRKSERMRGVGACPLNYLLYTHPLTREVLVDRILRYEDLDAELVDVFGRVGIPFAPPLSVRAKGGLRADGRDYRQVYNERQRRRVADLFAEEIALLGYTFEGA